MLGISKSWPRKGLLLAAPTILLGVAFFAGKMLYDVTSEPSPQVISHKSENSPTPTRKPTSTPTPRVKAATAQVVPTSTPTPNPDPTVNCRIHANCGGGTVSMKSSECSSSICCEIGSKWYLYPSKDKCSQDQATLHASNNTYTYTPTYPPTSTPYPTPTPTPIPDRTEEILECKDRALDIYQSDKADCYNLARAYGGASSSWAQQCIQSAQNDYEYRLYLCEH